MNDEEIKNEETTENDLKKRDFHKEITDILNSAFSDSEIREKLDDYHDNDIADVLEELLPEKRRKFYKILGIDRLSDIFTYFDDIGDFLAELPDELCAKIIAKMDADEASEALEELDAEKRAGIVSFLDDETKRGIRLVDSYDDDMVGSRMSTNFVSVKKSMSIKQAMTSLINQAAENDNIATIYVTDTENKFCGAIELRDLIVARAGMSLDDIMASSYPFLLANEKVEDCIEDLKDYSEDSIPVLDKDSRIVGVITASDVVEVVDTQMGEDYAMLAGLSEETDIDETVIAGAKKRIPWLIILLGLSLIVSSVVGLFEDVISGLTIIVSFQSLILGMSGNVGTQSLGVTLRVLISEEEMTLREKLSLVFKEARIGLLNGFVLGIASTAIIGLYIHLAGGVTISESFLISGCVGLSLMTAMFISSAVGTAVPMMLKALKFDPAVASGPLITTCNDLVAVTVYYGLAWLLLIGVFGLAG